METTITIDINDYLSESEKKEYAIEAFKEVIKKGMFNDKQGIQLDTEIQRVIGNISHYIVMEEVQKYIPNCEELIKQKTLQVINKDSFSYEVFKKKDVWDKEESLAIKYMNETIRENKELATMAHSALSKLCSTGGRSFTMTVPPRKDDTDMIFSEIITRFEKLTVLS